MSEPSEPIPPDEAQRRARIEAGVRAIREGHGANCSSIGSVVDTLFVTALLGGAVFAAVVAALGKEPIEVVGDTPPPPEDDPKKEDVPS